MRLKLTGIFIFSVAFAFCGCHRRSFGMTDDSEMIRINRFDSALLQWIESDSPVILAQIETRYAQMLEVLGKALFKTGPADSSIFFDNLINYYSEPALHALYKDAVGFYSAGSIEMAGLTEELSHGFARMKKLFPALQVPAVYMHVSGLQQNIIVADSLLSCSIDKYMGSGYPLYEDFFYSYQRKSMIPERIAKDCLHVWLKSEYPYTGKENVLLERMIYEGKIIYILTQTGKDCTFQNLLSLTDDEYKWCRQYESTLWTTIIERKHLYTPDIATTSNYFQPAPATFISAEAPGDLGYFIGYRIVEKYMKQTRSTCEELMNNDDAQDILHKSKYKP
ncbi:MAG: DUF2268 domain-containing putative Zn-dependent protease [Tannerella sp.]|nr:DUF2268 domain-containing putative Zn-dependent protease [Tannerella sp.]